MIKEKKPSSAKQLTKAEFIDELDKVKKSLPRHYGVLLKSQNSDIDMRKVYNVVNYNVHDEAVLTTLKNLIGGLEKK